MAMSYTPNILPNQILASLIVAADSINLRLDFGSRQANHRLVVASIRYNLSCIFNRCDFRLVQDDSGYAPYKPYPRISDSHSALGIPHCLLLIEATDKETTKAIQHSYPFQGSTGTLVHTRFNCRQVLSASFYLMKFSTACTILCCVNL